MRMGVNFTGQFWKGFIDKVVNQVIPYQWEAINDRIPGAEPSYSMHNFLVAAGKKEGKHGGFVYQDNDISKWIEAVAYSLSIKPDAELEALADDAIDTIVAAQQPDGYLNSYFILTGLEKRFTNLMENHELYCLGHFLEAAVAYYCTTGKKKLLNALVKYVDLVDATFGAEEGKLRGYPGHQEIEIALIKLYEVIKDEKHLKLAKYFIDERGRQPLYFKEEHEKYGNHYNWENSTFGYGYYQAHKPVRQQEEPIGHAVRALYMYSAMADVAAKTSDSGLMDVCLRLWHSVTRRQMYITGGVGTSWYGESFSLDYHLPNDTAYAETCASIALMFFAVRMFKYNSYKAEYMDVLERALYNGVLSGMSIDGTSFFYVNPLEVLPEAVEKDPLKAHVKVTRQKWFGCACCPPNIARVLTSLDKYAYTADGNRVYVNLFAESAVKTPTLAFNIATHYPWGGTVTVDVQTAQPEAELAIRIPGWCANFALSREHTQVNGYVLIQDITPGEKIVLELEMPVKIMQANPNVRENIGKVAICRGPLVYCLEEADNGKNLHLVHIQNNAAFELLQDEKLDAVCITTQGKRVCNVADELYVPATDTVYEDVTLTFVPYYLWANRTPGEMVTWVNY